MSREERPDGGSRHQPDRPRSKVDADIAMRVRESALKGLSAKQRRASSLYLDPWVVKAGATLGPKFEPVRVKRPSVLVFADDLPAANFAHPCRYFLYAADTGEPTHSLLADFPPYPLDGLEVMEAFHQAEWPRETVMRSGSGEAAGETRSGAASLMRAAAGRRFAILFAGQMDQTHLNSLELSYRTLVDHFGFDPQNIFPLIHDGTRGAFGRGPFVNAPNPATVRPWPGPDAPHEFRLGVEVPLRKGSEKALRELLLEELGPQLGRDDLLFIHVEGHGDRKRLDPDDHVYICGYPSADPDDPDPGKYFAFQLQEHLAALPRYRGLLVLMNQCYGGGFRDPVLQGSTAGSTHIACAARADALSRILLPDRIWNEFALHWLEAQRGKLLTGGPVNAAGGDGVVQASEAFGYADNVKSTNFSPCDTPNSGSAPGSAGNDLSLAN